MWPDARGPFLPSVLPLGPRVTTPGILWSTAVEAHVVLEAAELGAAAATTEIAPLAPGQVSLEFEAAHAAALAGLGALGRVEDASEYGTFAAHLGGIEGDADREQRDLPADGDPEPDMGLEQDIVTEPSVTPEEYQEWERQFPPDHTQPGT